MAEAQARCQAVAVSGATLVTFIGISHEVVGATLFPWGPDFLGGPVGWHAVGVVAIATGLGLLGGTLGLVRFPVAPVSLLVAASGAFFLTVAALLHQDFHFFALAGLVAGIGIAYFHRRAAQLAAAPDRATPLRGVGGLSL
jgi:hypothetical protein